MRYRKVLSCLTFFSFIVLSVFSQTDSCINNVRLGISFPPIADADQREFSRGHLENLNVSQIRIAENWALREPIQGSFTWGPLDARMEWVAENDYSTLLTIQSDGPEWACNDVLQNDLSCAFTDSVAFRRFIDSVLVRYGNDIDKIQFGNEWHSEYWYIGYASDFIKANNTVWESVQENAPQVQVVLGGFASGTMTSLAGCYGYLDSVRLPDSNVWHHQPEILVYCSSPEIEYIQQRQDSILSMCHYDIIDMHLYDDVENWPLYYHIMDSITGGIFPIIVTEMGGPNLFNELPYSDEFQAERLYEYIRCVDSLSITEAYYFKLVSGGEAAEYHQESGLIDGDNLSEKPAYYLFKTINCACGSSTCITYMGHFVNIYPNPASDYLTFDAENIIGIVVSDITGRVVLNLDNYQREINIQNFNCGIFLVRVNFADGSFTTKKVLIQR